MRRGRRTRGGPPLRGRRPPLPPRVRRGAGLRARRARPLAHPRPPLTRTPPCGAHASGVRARAALRAPLGWRAVLAVVLAFSSSLCWGLADFLGGLQSRTRPLVTVLLVAQVAAVAMGVAFVAASGDPFPDLGPAALATGAGRRGLRGAGRLLPRPGDRDDEHRRARLRHRRRRAGAGRPRGGRAARRRCRSRASWSRWPASCSPRASRATPRRAAPCAARWRSPGSRRWASGRSSC